MDKQQTLSIIKPDAIRRHLAGLINSRIEAQNLFIIGQKRLRLTKEQAAAFYHEHEERAFFDDLCQYMSSGPVVVQVLEAPDAIAQYRTLMGATNPSMADENTLRREFGLSIDENAIHGSDSLESAAKEIPFFFSQIELFKN